MSLLVNDGGITSPAPKQGKSTNVMSRNPPKARKGLFSTPLPDSNKRLRNTSTPSEPKAARTDSGDRRNLTSEDKGSPATSGDTSFGTMSNDSFLDNSDFSFIGTDDQSDQSTVDNSSSEDENQEEDTTDGGGSTIATENPSESTGGVSHDEYTDNQIESGNETDDGFDSDDDDFASRGSPVRTLPSKLIMPEAPTKTPPKNTYGNKQAAAAPEEPHTIPKVFDPELYPGVPFVTYPKFFDKTKRVLLKRDEPYNERFDMIKTNWEYTLMAKGIAKSTFKVPETNWSSDAVLATIKTTKVSSLAFSVKILDLLFKSIKDVVHGPDKPGLSVKSQYFSFRILKPKISMKKHRQDYTIIDLSNKNVAGARKGHATNLVRNLMIAAEMNGRGIILNGMPTTTGRLFGLSLEAKGLAIERTGDDMDNEVFYRGAVNYDCLYPVPPTSYLYDDTYKVYPTFSEDIPSDITSDDEFADTEVVHNEDFVAKKAQIKKEQEESRILRGLPPTKKAYSKTNFDPDACRTCGRDG
jgi:hypothetical protein